MRAKMEERPHPPPSRGQALTLSRREREDVTHFVRGTEGRSVAEVNYLGAGNVGEHFSGGRVAGEDEDLVGLGQLSE